MPEPHRVQVTTKFVKQGQAVLPDLAEKPAKEVARVAGVLERLRQRRPAVEKAEHAADMAKRRSRKALAKATKHLEGLQGGDLPSASTREAERRLRDARTLVAAYDARIERLREIASSAGDGQAAQQELDRLEPQEATLADQEAALAAGSREADEAQTVAAALRSQIAIRRHELEGARADLEAVACAWDQAPCFEDLRGTCPHLADARRARDEIGQLRDDDIVALEVRLAGAEATAESLRPEPPEGYDCEAHAQLRQRLNALRVLLQEAGRAQRAQRNLLSLERQRDKHAEREAALAEKCRACAERDEQTLAQAREEVERGGPELQEARVRLDEARLKRRYVQQGVRKQHKALVEARSALRSVVYLRDHYTPDTQ